MCNKRINIIFDLILICALMFLASPINYDNYLIDEYQNSLTHCFELTEYSSSANTISKIDIELEDEVDQEYCEEYDLEKNLKNNNQGNGNIFFDFITSMLLITFLQSYITVTYNDWLHEPIWKIVDYIHLRDGKKEQNFLLNY